MAKGSSSKKNAKGRLDKFYHLAKDQGYRARSAFKLIQLNKKYNFLSNAKCVVDLCAAPGGWLQVSQKYMPKPSLIIGLDLEKIKPIPGVITHVEDITSASCRTTLKRDLKTWKADVFLHDGAPNVGVSWLQDAFSQNELVLSSCKLATEFLTPGGTFVTKVFRSKDYNKLMWIFNQLFSKVEATKPTASRNVSAEIFVVCRGYLAPKKIDPRLLDSKYAFKEMDDTTSPEETDIKKIKAAQGQVLNDLMHPEKQKRHRDGYEDGATTLYVTNPVLEFIKSNNFLSLLAGSSALVFESGNAESQMILESSLTTAEIKEFLKDLKVLGKKEFRELIKWRNLMRILIGISTKAKEKEQVSEEPKPQVDMETMIENERLAQKLKNKREKKKQRERKQKLLLKLQLGMETPQDISQGDLEGLPEFDMGDNEEMEIDADLILKHLQNKTEAKLEDDESGSESEYLDSDDELILKVQRLDNQMDEMYEEFEKRRIERNPSQKVMKVKEASAAFEEWYGIGDDVPVAEDAKNTGEYDSDSGSSSDEEALNNDIDIPMNQRSEEETNLSKKAKLFFDNPVFDGLKSYQEEDSMFKDELVMHHKNDKNSRKKSNDDDQKGFEVVAATEYVEPATVEEDSDDEDTPLIDSAQAYTIAQKMLTKSGKRDLIDDSFNRYAFNDPEALPSWFVSDESKHNKPSLPPTKEAVQIMKDRMKQLDARPIKKIAEAKFRKQLRTQRRIMKAAAKSQGLADNEDLSERSKLEQAAKVMGKAKKKVRAEKEKVKVVVAQGRHKAIQGRPKGVKGRYKMVDGPMKKETRALKRVAKKTSKKRR